MKKFMLTIAAVLFGFSAFAEEYYYFSNELSSDTMDVKNSDFTGALNTTLFDIGNEKFDAEIYSVVELTTDENTKPEGIKFNDFDWFFNFKPVEKVTLHLSDNIWAAGSYMFIDDYWSFGGRMGSDGFSVSTTIVPNLKLVATVPFSLDAENAFSSCSFGFGAEYNIFGKAIVSGIVKYEDDDFGEKVVKSGAYISFTPIEELVINAGYSHKNWGIGYVEADDIFLASGSYSVKDVTVLGDFATSKDAFYAAGTVKYQIESFIPAVTVKYFDAIDTMECNPRITYTVGCHELTAGIKVTVVEKSVENVTIPVSWKVQLMK